MSRLLIVASKQQLEPVISELYRMNIFHIDDFVEKGDDEWEGFKIGMPMKGADIASASLVKIRSIASTFGISTQDIEPEAKASIAELKRRVEQELPAIAEEVEALLSRRTRHESAVKELEQKIEALRPFTEFPARMDLLSGYDTASVIAGYVKSPVTLSVPHEIWTNQLKSGLFIVLVVRNEHLAVAERELFEFQLQKVTIPDEHDTAPEAIASYEQQIVGLQTEIESLTAQMNTIREKHQYFLLSSEELLAADVDQAEAPLRFATSELTFSVTGWVPQSKVARVFENLDRACGGRVYVSELEVQDYNEQPPVEYHNPDFAHPTELFMDLYSRPRYTEVDPSLLMAIVYPIMFGLILGDVGYGLILLVMAFGLRSFVKGSEAGNQLLTVLRNCSICSIAFGIFFSEVFGFKLPWEPLWLSRHINMGGTEAAEQAVEAATTHGMASAAEHVSHIPQLLVLSIWVGILHITLGRLWGARNAAKMDHGHHRSLKIYANIGWILVMWGILVAIWSKFPIPFMPDLSGLPALVAGLNLATIAGAVMLILGLVFIARENVLDLFEVPTIISHVLSYTRLIAVGLSSVAIAMVTNFIAIDMIIHPQLAVITPVGIVLIIAGIGVFLFGHALNTVLGILGGGLHPLRLHYVEFFTKFYRGGGKRYNPFGMVRRLTEQN
jgi:V/A-type H+-transporting ATPase subunit I